MVRRERRWQSPEGPQISRLVYKYKKFTIYIHPAGKMFGQSNTISDNPTSVVSNNDLHHQLGPKLLPTRVRPLTREGRVPTPMPCFVEGWYRT